MGNYISALEAMMDRFWSLLSYNFVYTYEHPNIMYNYQRNRQDGSGLAWDINRLTDLNELEFCSMIGHDADVRIFLYPIIEERIAVIKEARERAEFEWTPQDEADFQLLVQGEIFELWEIWRMCQDDAISFATTRAEIFNNFALAGFDGDVVFLMELFEPTLQRDLEKSVTFMNEAIGFGEFAIRLYTFLHTKIDERDLGDELLKKTRKLEERGGVDGMFLRARRKSRELRVAAWKELKQSIQWILEDMRLRRQGIPYRFKAIYQMF